MQGSTVFISYRRSESASYAGHLGDALRRQLGEDRVMLDFDNIEPGASFVESLQRAVERCEVMLVLIGPQWLAHGRDGRPRLADPGDFVRGEIAAALRLNKRVVPVLIDGARLPEPAELPDELKPLLTRIAMRLSADRWEEDLAALVTQLGGAPSAFSTSRRVSGFAALLEMIGSLFSGSPSSPQPSAAPTAPAMPPSPAPPPPAGGTADRKVFLSHASEDRSLVTEVLRALESAGLRCWVSFRDIADGEPSWAGAITDAIANSALMVVVVSKDAIASRQVLREVSIADSENIPFLPFCVDTTPLSSDRRYFFSAGQRLDASGLARDESLARLVVAARLRAGAAASWRGV